jgi:hypothetical protein
VALGGHDATPGSCNRLPLRGREQYPPPRGFEYIGSLIRAPGPSSGPVRRLPSTLVTAFVTGRARLEADGGGLENRYGVIPIKGSNPLPSAACPTGTPVGLEAVPFVLIAI